MADKDGGLTDWNTNCRRLFALGIIVLVIYCIWPIYITPLRKIPGPSSENPFYGNLGTFLLEESPDLKWIQKYGNIIKYHGLFKPSLSQIQNQEITLNHVYEYIKPPKCWLMVLNCW
ncbi:unnamed protein product [Rhizophagus irregularis]|nr:unnamed protein product [Rhizophagus irregularis]